MSSLFEKIANREIPGFIFWENDDYFAFLSIGPLNEGHTLVAPKKNLSDHLFDLQEADYSELMQASYKVASVLKAKFSCDRILTWVEGFEVPHVHVHLLPVMKGFNIRTAIAGNPSNEELEKVYQKIMS